MATNNRKKRRKKKGRKKIVLFIFEVLLLAVVLGVLWLYNSTFGKVTWENELSNSEAGINQDLDKDAAKKMHGYLNVALFGLDNRSNGDYNTGHSDCIMIVSLNYDTNEVRLVSVYRDTYLSSGGGKFTKANFAYESGGAPNAVAMLNSNLDLDITKYVSVDWKALVDAIDELDGIDLEITEAERKEINFLLPEIDGTTGYRTGKVTDTGMVHLNGTQATAYARIRSTAGDDFLRASRQRIVLEAMINKMKETDIATLTSMLSDIMGQVCTNFTQTELISLATDLTEYNLVSTTGFPFELTTKTLSSTGDTVIPIDFSKNVTELHQYLFADDSYTPSNTVETLSSKIANKTGVTSKTAAYDLTQYNETVGADGTDAVKDTNKEKAEQEKNSSSTTNKKEDE